MSSPRFETFLARLYSDAAFLERFLASPAEAMMQAGLDEREKMAASQIDRVGLTLAARSYRSKRAQRQRSMLSFLSIKPQ